MKRWIKFAFLGCATVVSTSILFTQISANETNQNEQDTCCGRCETVMQEHAFHHLHENKNCEQNDGDVTEDGLCNHFSETKPKKHSFRHNKCR